MNPPPLPKSQKPSVPQRFAFGSLLAPLLAALVWGTVFLATHGGKAAPVGNLVIAGLTMLLILMGLIFAIIAVSSFSRHGSSGTLGFGLAGLIVNGALALVFVVALISGLNRAWTQRGQNRQANQDLQSFTEDMRQDLRASYDPEKGITNVDSAKMDRVTREFNDAAAKMSGDDAAVAKAIVAYLTEVQRHFKTYESALKEFTAAEVLNVANLDDKSQIEPRRAVVRRFLEANAALGTAIRDADKIIRAGLTAGKLSASKIETVMQGYNSKAARRQSLTLQIRECDRKLGDAALGMLDLIEAQWGHWKYDQSSNELTFSEAEHNVAYGNFVDEMDAAAQKQVKLQGLLVNLE